MYEEDELLITRWNIEKFYELFKFYFCIQSKHFLFNLLYEPLLKENLTHCGLPALVICLFFTVPDF